MSSSRRGAFYFQMFSLRMLRNHHHHRKLLLQYSSHCSLFNVQCSVFNQCAFYRTRKNWRKRRRERRGKIEIAHVQHNIKRPCGHILVHASSNRNTGAPQLQLEWMNGWIEMFVGKKEEKKLEQNPFLARPYSGCLLAAWLRSCACW